MGGIKGVVWRGWLEAVQGGLSLEGLLESAGVVLGVEERQEVGRIEGDICGEGSVVSLSPFAFRVGEFLMGLLKDTKHVLFGSAKAYAGLLRVALDDWAIALGERYSEVCHWKIRDVEYERLLEDKRDMVLGLANDLAFLTVFRNHWYKEVKDQLCRQTKKDFGERENVEFLERIVESCEKKGGLVEEMREPFAVLEANALMRLGELKKSSEYYRRAVGLLRGVEKQVSADENAVFVELLRKAYRIDAADRLDKVWVVSGDRFGVVENYLVFKELTERVAGIREFLLKRRDVLCPGSIAVFSLPDGRVVEVMERVSVETVFSWMNSYVEWCGQLDDGARHGLNVRKLEVFRQGLRIGGQVVSALEEVVPAEFVHVMKDNAAYDEYVKNYLVPRYEIVSGGVFLHKSGILDGVIIPRLVGMPRRLSRDLNQGNVFINGVQIDLDVLVKGHDLMDASIFLEPFGLSVDERHGLLKDVASVQMIDAHGGVDGLLRDFDYASWWSMLGFIGYYHKKKYKTSKFAERSRADAVSGEVVPISKEEEEMWRGLYDARIDALKKGLYELALSAYECSRGVERDEWRGIADFMKDAEFVFKVGPFPSGKELLSS